MLCGVFDACGRAAYRVLSIGWCELFLVTGLCLSVVMGCLLVVVC